MSQPTFYQPGDRLRVILDNAAVESHDGDGLVLNLGGNARIVVPVVLPSDTTTVATERVAPAEWPPEVGDLWRDRHNGLWFTYRQHVRSDSHGVLLGTVLRMTPCRPTESFTPARPADVLERHGPMTLVHREEQPDGGDGDE